MNDGEELVVAVELEIGDVGGRAAVDDELVEDFELFAFDAVGWGVGEIVVVIGRQGFRVVLDRVGRPPTVGGAIDGAGKAHAEVDVHALLAHDAIEVSFIRGELEVCKKAKGAKGKGEDRGHDALEEPGGEEDCAITAEGENKVKFLGRCPA